LSLSSDINHFID